MAAIKFLRPAVLPFTWGKAVDLTIPPGPSPSPPGWSGDPLPGDLREILEEHFGVDLRGVRIHDDARARSFLDGRGAGAAVGDHVYLGKPVSKERLGRLGHEVAHVVQHRRGRTPRRNRPGERTAELERDALEHERRLTGRRTARARVLGTTAFATVDGRSLGRQQQERLERIKPALEKTLERLLGQTLPHRTVDIESLSVQVGLIDFGRSDGEIVHEIAHRVLLEAKRAAERAREADGAPVPADAVPLYGDGLEAGAGEPCHLRIAADPDCRPALLETTVEFDWCHDQIVTAQGDPYPRILSGFEWEVTPPGGTKQGYGRRGSISVKLSAQGRWRISVPIEWSRDDVHDLVYYQDVTTADAIATSQLPQSSPGDYVRFRTGVELRTVELSGGTPANPTSGVPRITCDGPNPAGATTDRDHAILRYTMIPTPAGTRFRWYVRCASMEGMPAAGFSYRIAQFGEGREFSDAPPLVAYSRQTIDGQDAFVIPSYLDTAGRTFPLAITNANVYTIVCEELGEDRKPRAAATYVQKVLPETAYARLEAWRRYSGRADEAIIQVREGTEVAVSAIHVGDETGAILPISLFIGVDAADALKLKLVDLTPNVPVVEYGGSSVESVFDDFESNNYYPTGLIKVEVPPNTAGIKPYKRDVKPKGRSTAAEWAGRLGWVSLGLGVAAFFVPGGQVVAVCLILSATTGAVAGGLSIYDRIRQAEVDKAGIAIDVLSIASSILGGAAAFRVLASGGKTIVLASGRWPYVLWAGCATGATAGALISVEGCTAIKDVVDSDLPRSAKIALIARNVANLALNGGLLGLSIRDLGRTRQLIQQMREAFAAAKAAKKGTPPQPVVPIPENDVATLGLLDEDRVRRVCNRPKAEIEGVAESLRRDPSQLSPDTAPAPATPGDVVLDTNVALDLEKRALLGTPRPGSEKRLQVLDSRGIAPENRLVTPRTVAEHEPQGGTFGVRFRTVATDPSVPPAELAAIDAELAAKEVGGDLAEGVGDRAVVRDALLAQRTGSEPVTLVTGDRELINGLAQFAGIDVANLGGRNVAQHIFYTRDGATTFVATVRGRQVRVMPLMELAPKKRK